MGESLEHIPVKLIVGLIAKKAAHLVAAIRILEKRYGKIERETPLLDFSCTSYYEEEFGAGLKRKFISFANRVNLRENFRIKLYTNRIEKKLSQGGRRSVNIDPGYVTLSKLVLFTTKDSSHRIYIANGIYGDVELMFANGTFRPLDWTYPDFRTSEYVEFFNSVRNDYSSQIKTAKDLKR